MLNQERYPAVDHNLSFPNQQFLRAYYDAAKFSKNFYGMNDLITHSNITPANFRDKFPLMVFDVSKQSERLKSSVVDIQIKATFNAAVPARTEAFVVVISDRMLQFQTSNLTAQKYLLYTDMIYEIQIVYIYLCHTYETITMKYTNKQLKKMLADNNIDSCANNKVELYLQLFDANILKREDVFPPKIKRKVGRPPKEKGPPQPPKTKRDYYSCPTRTHPRKVIYTDIETGEAFTYDSVYKAMQVTGQCYSYFMRQNGRIVDDKYKVTVE